MVSSFAQDCTAVRNNPDTDCTAEAATGARILPPIPLERRRDDTELYLFNGKLSVFILVSKNYVYVLAAPLCVPQFVLSDGDVVELLKLRQRLNNGQSISEIIRKHAGSLSGNLVIMFMGRLILTAVAVNGTKQL